MLKSGEKGETHSRDRRETLVNRRKIKREASILAKTGEESVLKRDGGSGMLRPDGA